jgi:hypothetical protein
MAGREKGLAIYCTQVRGYREGALGQKYLGACPAQSAGQFLSGYEFGKRIYQTERRSSDVANEIFAVSQKLQSPKLPNAQREPLLQEQSRLQAEDIRLKKVLEQLRSQADTLVAAARKKKKN